MTRPGSSPLICPCCGSTKVFIFYEADSVPVNSVLLMATREEATGFPTGDIRLGFCDDCGFIYNTAFDPKLVEYSSRYEETQAFSPAFRKWHLGLAQRLVEQYGLRDKTTLEIGCGKGEFLTLLCELGAKNGIGFDPGYLPQRNLSPAANRIRFVSDYYSEQYAGQSADLVCCKMTLEHIRDVAAFVRMVRQSLNRPEGTMVFFQVPDVLRVLEEVAFWDIYYEHCSYFSIGSLERLFRRVGFEVLNVSREYDNQYLTIEGRAADGETGVAAVAREDDLDLLRGLVSRFAERQSSRASEWRQRLQQYRDRNQKAVIWGSGSKGVGFLTTLDQDNLIEYAVDINPNRHGYYMPKTGQQIVAPTFLGEYRPEVVIVMNPVYRAEITTELERLGLAPEVICA
jgi:SAM-dependent methyltransferase